MPASAELVSPPEAPEAAPGSWAFGRRIRIGWRGVLSHRKLASCRELWMCILGLNYSRF